MTAFLTDGPSAKDLAIGKQGTCLQIDEGGDGEFNFGDGVGDVQIYASNLVNLKKLQATQDQSKSVTTDSPAQTTVPQSSNKPSGQDDDVQEEQAQLQFK